LSLYTVKGEKGRREGKKKRRVVGRKKNKKKGKKERCDSGAPVYG